MLALTVALILTLLALACVLGGWWRIRRTLLAERARARLLDTRHHHEAAHRRLRETAQAAVLAEASAVVDRAYRRYQPAYREGEPDA